MKTLRFVGIGTGNPDHITWEGVAAIKSSECILIPRKGQTKDDLAEIRRGLVRRIDPDAVVLEYDMPDRDPELPYANAVEQWHDEIACVWKKAIPENAETIAFLVWGDPSLYDSSLRIAARLRPEPKIEVFPGITSLQVLTAAFSIPLNEINKPVLITTGRQLRDNGWPDGVDRIAVMLDGSCSFQHLAPDGVSIWWGAFLGLPNQLLRSGPLTEVGDEIMSARKKARAEHGWIMDTYILSRDRM